jgi:hypothetical protein
LSVKRLEAVLQHWAILLFQDIFPNLNYQIRPDSKYVHVVCSVMYFAKRKTVGNYRFALRMSVGEDVCGIEKRAMTQAAYGAALFVCI